MQSFMQPGKKKKASSHTWWSIAIFCFPYQRLLLANTARTVGGPFIFKQTISPIMLTQCMRRFMICCFCRCCNFESCLIHPTHTHLHTHNVLHLMSPLFREHRSCLCKADEYMNNKRRHALTSTRSHQQCTAHLSSRRHVRGRFKLRCDLVDLIWSSASSNLHPQEDLLPEPHAIAGQS
jgi:hypothetical protein